MKKTKISLKRASAVTLAGILAVSPISGGYQMVDAETLPVETNSSTSGDLSTLPSEMSGYLNSDKTISYSISGTVMTVTGTGTMEEVSNYYDFEDITEVNISGISVIGERAFRGFGSLQKVTLSEGVTKIGRSAFSGCSELQDINFPESLKTIDDYAFWGAGFTSLELPDTITSIGLGAFSYNDNLVSVTIPNSITVIPNSLFYYCLNLSDLTLPTAVSYIDEQALECCSKSLTIKTSSVYVKDYCEEHNINCIYTDDRGGTADKEGWANKDGSAKYFVSGTIMTISGTGNINPISDYYSEYKDLTKIIVNDGITGFNDSPYVGTFEDCLSVTNVILPNSINYLPKRIFKGCSSLVTIDIPSDIIEIPDNTFDGCVSLDNIIIPSGVTIIGHKAFAKCTSLTNINIPSDVTTFGEYLFLGCTSLKTVILPRKIEELNDGIFSGCSSLFDVIIPDKVEAIGVSAFDSCYNLRSIEIPEAVTKIGGSAFNNCSKLEEIAIPQNVEFLGSKVFNGCSSLRKAVIESEANELDIREECFSGCTGLEEVILTNNISKIPSKMFYNCVSLTSIEIPEAVKAMEDRVFSNCSKNLKVKTSSDYVKSYCEKNNIDVIYKAVTKPEETTGEEVTTKPEETTGEEVTTEPEETTGEEVTTEPEETTEEEVTTEPEETTEEEVTTEPEETTKEEETKKVHTKDVILSYSAKKLKVKQSFRLSAIQLPVNTVDKIKWSSSNSRIAKVDSKGLVKAVKAGKCTITATASSGAKAKCTITVTCDPSSIKLNKKTLSLSKGKSYKLKYVIPKYSVTKVTFKTSNKKVATVSSSGVVKAKEKGTAKITVVTSNGKKSTCTVKVK